MQLTYADGKLRVSTPCKVNPFLEVVRRRPDGFHNLETLMIGVDLCDQLEFELADDRTWDLQICSNSPWLQEQIGYNGERLGDVQTNLVWSALQALSTKLKITKGISIKLRKSIPIQAGLGGGSSDAAATLVAAQWLWTGRYDHRITCELAAGLGSDVNFFMEGSCEGTWAASCSGRGETVRPFELKRDVDWLLVCPPFGCNTSTVFRQVKLTDDPPRTVDQAVKYYSSKDCGVAMDHVHYNRLYAAAVAAYPELYTFHEKLRNIDGSVKFVMTGSGSTLIAECPRTKAIELAERISRQEKCFTYVGNCWKSRSIAEQIDDLDK